MRKRKIQARIPPARALRARQDRIAELNVSVIVQAGFALWIEPVALWRRERYISEGLLFPSLPKSTLRDRVSYEMNVTPQTILINSDGKVEKLWIGLFRPDDRSDVEQYFRLKLPQITSSNHFSERARIGDG